MQFDVFISYPHQNKTTADAACVMLEAQGIRCWIAPRDIGLGADWAASIVAAINRCRLMLLIFSASANTSKQVHREVQQALDNEKPVVPLRIENVAPQGPLAYYLGPLHWLDALTPPVEKHLSYLAASISAFLRVERSAETRGQEKAQGLPFENRTFLSGIRDRLANLKSVLEENRDAICSRPQTPDELNQCRAEFEVVFDSIDQFSAKLSLQQFQHGAHDAEELLGTTRQIAQRAKRLKEKYDRT